MSQKPQTSLHKLADKWGGSKKPSTAKIDPEISNKYNSIRRQNVQGEQCVPCFECYTVINGNGTSYYEAWETIREDSDQVKVPILRKLCYMCGIKFITPENIR